MHSIMSAVPNAKSLNAEVLVAWLLDVFEFKFRYYASFRTNTSGKRKKSLILPPPMGQIVSLLFYKDGLGIE